MFKDYFHSFLNILWTHSYSIYNCSISILKLHIDVYLQANMMMLSYCSLTKSMDFFCHKIKGSAEPILTIYYHEEVRPWSSQFQFYGGVWRVRAPPPPPPQYHKTNMQCTTAIPSPHHHHHATTIIPPISYHHHTTTIQQQAHDIRI